MRANSAALALLIALAAVPAAAAAPSDRTVPAPGPRQAPLGLDEVLASARFHAPQVIEALARQRGAEGKRLSAEAAFDTVFSAEAETRLTGYYDGRYAETRVTRPFTGIGGYAYGGYRISGGEFPIYEDERYTNRLGEVKAGAVLSLLRDRIIDERRFALGQADADIALAEADRVLVAVGVQTRAIQAYNNWVVAGLRLAIYRDLLKLAEDRQQGFRRQVDTGARPAILLTENEQNILRRRTLVAQSEQTLAQAAVSLSLYLRDGNGRPLVPPPQRLPGALPPPLRGAADARAAIARRPDIRALSVRIAQAGQRLALDRNALLPKLDLKAEVSQDIGGIGPGGSSRSGTESKVGITLSVPLEQRAARGRLAQTRAEIDAATARQLFLQDQIATDIGNLDIAVAGSARLAALAADEADRAAAMATAERRRFELGASDFFLVNVREEAAADAAVRRLDAAFRQVVANADLAAATADFDALGL